MIIRCVPKVRKLRTTVSTNFFVSVFATGISHSHYGFVVFWINHFNPFSVCRYTLKIKLQTNVQRQNDISVVCQLLPNFVLRYFWWYFDAVIITCRSGAICGKQKCHYLNFREVTSFLSSIHHNVSKLLSISNVEFKPICYVSSHNDPIITMKLYSLVTFKYYFSLHFKYTITTLSQFCNFFIIVINSYYSVK